MYKFELTQISTYWTVWLDERVKVTAVVELVAQALGTSEPRLLICKELMFPLYVFTSMLVTCETPSTM